LYFASGEAEGEGGGFWELLLPVGSGAPDKDADEDGDVDGDGDGDGDGDAVAVPEVSTTYVSAAVIFGGAGGLAPPLLLLLLSLLLMSPWSETPTLPSLVFITSPDKLSIKVGGGRSFRVAKLTLDRRGEEEGCVAAEVSVGVDVPVLLGSRLPLLFCRLGVTLSGSSSSTASKKSSSPSSIILDFG